ncbi:hypothetical protein OKW11_001682 [Pseudomonas baetica]|nr:hypothetical protein [Pseudomonas baetica]
MLMTVKTAYHKRFNVRQFDAEIYDHETPMPVRNSLY